MMLKCAQVGLVAPSLRFDFQRVSEKGANDVFSKLHEHLKNPCFPLFFPSLFLLFAICFVKLNKIYKDYFSLRTAA